MTGFIVAFLIGLLFGLSVSLLIYDTPHRNDRETSSDLS